MPDVDQAPPPESLTEEQRRLVVQLTMTAMYDLAGRPELLAARGDVLLFAVVATVLTVAESAGCDVPRMVKSIAAREWT